MSTASKQTGRQYGPWANLVICGGLSWGVNLWHALNATSGNAKVAPALALLCATGPVVSAAFASHNVAHGGGKWFKQTLTYLVFAMGMALSITAQAEAVQGVFGNIGFGVTFALMLDLSAFMSLHSIMSAAPESAPAETPAVAPVSAPAGPPVGAPVAPPVERLPDVKQAAPEPPVGPPPPPPADRPKRPRTAAAKKPSKGNKLTPAEARAKAWELLKNNPDMPSPELAVALGKSPKSGHVRDMKAKILREMQETGELPSVRAIGA